MSTEIDYSIGYHHVNCDEYFWPDSEQRIYPCVLFLANTRDEKIYQENVSILSHMYKSLGKEFASTGVHSRVCVECFCEFLIRVCMSSNRLYIAIVDESPTCI